MLLMFPWHLSDNSSFAEHSDQRVSQFLQHCHPLLCDPLEGQFLLCWDIIIGHISQVTLNVSGTGNNSYKVLSREIAHSGFSINVNFYNKLTFFLSKINTI